MVEPDATTNATTLATLQDELRHRERQIAAIHRISDALSSRLDVEGLIRETLNVAIEVLNADTGSLQMYDAETQTLVFRYVAAPEDAALIGYAMPITEGISGRVFRTGVPDLAQDVSQTADFNASVDAFTGYQTRSAVTVPLKRATGAALGVMQLLNLRESFNQHDLEVLEVLGAQAALALETARLAALARKAEIVSVIGNVSHDIYNMMTPLESGLLMLQTSLEVLFDKVETLREAAEASAPSEELAAAAAAAVEAHSDSGWIIEQALAVNKRVQARTRWIAGAVKGRLPLPIFEAVNLNRVAAEVVSALHPMAQKSEVTLELDLDASLPVAQLDPEHIYNALYNLVYNAVPETPAGGTVTLRTRAPEPDSDTLLLQVDDTGRGMPPEVSATLFTDAAISTKPGGTGLGTRIVKHVVDQHHGTVSAASEVGQGSTFTIRLPLAQRAA